MPTLLDRTAQHTCSTWQRHEGCRRAVCRRYRYCVPPRDEENPPFFRCPFDTDDAWSRRAALVAKLADRLMKIGETSRAARGLPSPFALRPVPDHLDVTKPLDIAAFLAQTSDE